MVFGTATSPPWSPSRVLRFVDALPATSRYRARLLGQAILDGDIDDEAAEPDLVNDLLARHVHELTVGMRAARESDVVRMLREVLDRVDVVRRVAAGFVDGGLDIDQVASSPWDARWPDPPEADQPPARRLQSFLAQYEAGRRGGH